MINVVHVPDIDDGNIPPENENPGKIFGFFWKILKIFSKKDDFPIDKILLYDTLYIHFKSNRKEQTPMNTKPTPFRIPPELKEQATTKAKKEKRTLASIVIESLREYVKQGDLQEQIDELRKRLDELEKKVQSIKK